MFLGNLVLSTGDLDPLLPLLLLLFKLTFCLEGFVKLKSALKIWTVKAGDFCFSLPDGVYARGRPDDLKPPRSD
jgi:hypothetical protein